MKQKTKRAASVLAAAALCAVSLMSGGCAKKNQTTSGNTVEYPADGVYPMKCDDTLSMWIELNATMSTLVSNFGETEIAQQLEKETGVKIEYMHPAAGSAAEQFNLLLTSDDMPDIMAGNWYTYGGQKALDEGILVCLNDVMDKWAPNYQKVLADMPNVDSMLKTDSGKYYSFGFIREDKALGVYAGPILRADWLKKLNLEVPETIDEWETMLTAFKDQLHVESPLMVAQNANAFTAGFLCGAYGVTDTFYLDNGKVKYGPVQDGYKEFVQRMKKWYDAGLLDKNFSGADVKILESAMLNGKTGASYQLAGGGMGTWLHTAKANGDNELDLVGAPYPVLNKGDRPQLSQMDWQYTPLHSWGITKSCKNVELATRFLDYGYSDKGYMLYNYGTEGVTYEMKDGKPVFTDFTLHNPDGKTISEILSRYAETTSSAPSLQSPEVVSITREFPQQNAAIDTWKETDMEKHAIPMINFTPEEQQELGTIVTDLQTYQAEMFYGFVMGTEDLGSWDEYLSRMDQIGASKAVEIYQKAVDRYTKR